MRVMARCDGPCPSLWTTCIGGALAEARDGLLDTDVVYGVEAHPHDGAETELEWAGFPMGQQAMRRAAAAAQCAIEMIQRHFFIVGFPAERQRGREYWRWAAIARREGGIRASTLSVPDADMREDISVFIVPEGRSQRLRPDKLSPIEKATQTLILFDDGGGSAVADGHRRILICGGDESQREFAKEWIQYILDAHTFDATAPDRPVSSTSSSRPSSFYDAGEDREPKFAKVTRSNPRDVLDTIPWPASINAWGQLQKKVWAGHAPLAPGWIRVWSKSKDSEYYLRLKDMKTSFDIEDVI